MQCGCWGERHQRDPPPPPCRCRCMWHANNHVLWAYVYPFKYRKSIRMRDVNWLANVGMIFFGLKFHQWYVQGQSKSPNTNCQRKKKKKLDDRNVGTDPAMQKRFSTLKLPRSRVWNILTPSIHGRLSTSNMLQPVIYSYRHTADRLFTDTSDFGAQIPTFGLIRSSPIPGIFCWLSKTRERALVRTLNPCHHFLRRSQILQEQLLRTCFFFPLKIDEMTLDRHYVTNSQFSTRSQYET